MKTKLIEIISVEERFPDADKAVIVFGGLAKYDSYRRVWVSQSGESIGKQIMWRVTWWAELIY
jgi:hypothetical protein